VDRGGVKLVRARLSGGLRGVERGCHAPSYNAWNPGGIGGDASGCDGNEVHVFIGRVESTPIPYEDRIGRGIQFDVTVDRVLPASLRSGLVAPTPTTGERIRVQRLLVLADGRPLSEAIPNYPRFPEIVLGMTTVFTIGGPAVGDPTRRPGAPLPLDPQANTLTAPWMQFPVGTPASQILDPSEWGNPVRGCDPVCRPNYLPQFTTDAALDVGPLDASDAVSAE
jgi:hypothetical protein